MRIITYLNRLHKNRPDRYSQIQEKYMHMIEKKQSVLYNVS